MPFRIERNDITKVHTDAIVNTANSKPAVGTGTDSAIYTAAGINLLLEERKKIGTIKCGEAAYTSGFNLFDTNGIRYIIHTVGTEWNGGEQGEIDVMRNCYRNSLRIAKELNCKSISIPLLATGNFGFPKEISLSIALDEISRFLFNSEMEIVLVVYDKESFQISKKVFDGVKSFINENYIGKKRDVNMGTKIRDYILAQDLTNQEDEKNSEIQEVSYSRDRTRRIPEKNISIDDYMAQNKGGLNFQELLKKYIQEKGMDNPTVYKKSIIVDKKLFSKIINGHIPNKHSVMALGLALELDLDSYQLFLATANFALNPADMFDTVVKYCVTQKIYDVMKVDSILFQMDLPCFNE